MWSKIKTFTLAIWTDLVDTYQRSKLALLGILMLAIYFGWERIKEWFIAYSGQKEINKDKKEDSVLAATENKDNVQADALIQQAKDLPSQQPSVTSDWYKDQK
jgi:hypothetical protein